MSLRPRSYSGDLITSIVSREAPFERNVRARTNPVNNMYRVPTYAKTKSSYGRKKPISQRKAVATAKRHNFKVNVERVLQRRVEVKKAQIPATQVNVTAYNVDNLLSCASMVPYSVILQGTGQSGRVGNRIRTRKCEFSFVLTPNNYNSVLNNPILPQEVVMYFGVVKNSKPIKPVAADFARLFQAGNAVAAPTSSLIDITSEINTDYFTVRKMCRFKVGFSGYAGTGVDVNAQSYVNNDYKYNVVRTLDLTSICPKTLMFNDGTDQPTNDGLWMWVQAVPGNGSVAATQRPVRMEYTIRFSYEDI